MLKMIGDASGRLKEKGLDWTGDEMELMSEGLEGKSNISGLLKEGRSTGSKRLTLKGHGRTHYEGS